MIKVCNNCNKEVKDKWNYCRYCGHLLIGNILNEIRFEVINTKLESMMQSIFTFIALSVTYYAIGITIYSIPIIEKPLSMKALEISAYIVGSLFIIFGVLSYFKYRTEYNKHKVLLKREKNK